MDEDRVERESRDRGGDHAPVEAGGDERYGLQHARDPFVERMEA